MQTQSLTKHTLRIFFEHTAKYKLATAMIFVGIIFTTAGDLLKPFLYSRLVNGLVAINAPGQADRAVKLLLWILLLGLGIQITWRIIAIVHNRTQARIMSDLLNTCYQYLQGHSHAFFTNHIVGGILAKIRRYPQAYEHIDDQLKWNVERIVLFTIAINVIMFMYHRMFGVIMFSWSLLYVAFSYYFSRYVLRHDIASANQETKVNAHLGDTLTNSDTIKLFSAHHREFNAFKGITETLCLLRKKSWNMGVRAEVFQSLSMVLLEFVVMYLALKEYRNGLLQIGDLVLLQGYLSQLFDQLWNLGRNIRQIYENLGNANEMTEMLLEPHEIVDRDGADDLQVSDGIISFQQTTVGYGKAKPVFSSFDLGISKGELLALVGESGVGKSTLVKALLRFSEPLAGQIMIDGQDITQVTQGSLRKQIAFVPQDPILFHRSLFDNIRYGRWDATYEEVVEAAKAAHCHKFIMALPDGYDTLVGERGVKLSGGQRQRIAIARALLQDAPILVLDEATSSLDSKSERLIQHALRRLMHGRTTIVIAHRLSTIKQMHRIVVLKDGKIAEEGKHDDLIGNQGGLYKRLWEIQAGGFQMTGS